MKNHKRMMLIPIAAVLFLFTGCWDRQELDEMFIPYTMGIDVAKDDSQMIIVTLTSPTIEEKAKEPQIVICSEGRSVRAVKESLQRKVYRNVNFGHIQVVLFGEEAARRGISLFLDTMERDSNIKGTVNIAVVKGTAEAFLTNAKLKQNPYMGMFLKGIIHNGKKKDIAPSMTLRDFATFIYSGIREPTMPYLTLAPDQDEIILSNTAFFKGDRLIGILDDQESIYQMMLGGSFENGIISMDIPKTNEDGFHNSIAIEIRKGSIKIDPVLDQGRIKVKLDIKMTVRLLEHTPPTRIATNKDIQKLNRKLETFIGKGLGKVVKRLQEQECDTIGLGEKVRVKYPKLFKEKSWPKDFSRAEFEINVKVNIKSQGLEV